MQGEFDQPENEDTEPEGVPKRSRLDAVANNAPWKNLLPANDKDTLQRMRRHREEEVKYSALNEEQKRQAPRVFPYPETPDAVFPGTPCYRITVDGKYIYVFVLEPAVRYKTAWDGRQRPQQQGYWIVPHFIYRNPKDVIENKDRWKQAYERYVKDKKPPPDKTDYEDDPKTTKNSSNHYCYYAPAVNNEENDADKVPPIEDPLFTPPFNNNSRFKDRHMVGPFPYNQNKNEFPVRTKPTLVPIIPEGRGARDGARGVKQFHDPHPSELDIIPPRYRGRDGVDWISKDEKNYEVGADYLKEVCERAEELDYNFAQSMQGLRGTNISAVWTCTDPEYDITDRGTVLAQFVRMYMEKFYTHISVMGSTDVEEVVHEALRLHEEFCKGWVHRHHRTLSPEINAASEALVGLYFEQLKALFPRQTHVTRAHISRFLRRHPDYCGEFAYCLYHYMTSQEHMRGNRNPSYKAMSSERNAHITALRRMGDMLFNGGNLAAEFATYQTSIDLVFDVKTVDWHYIASQMPQHHKEFDGFTNSFNLYRTRTGGRANAFPPWQQMRR